MAVPLRFLRKPDVLQREGFANSTLYDNIKRGVHTRPVQLGANSSGWPEHEVDLLMAARMAGKSDDEIRELVNRLHAQRVELFDDLAKAS